MASIILQSVLRSFESIHESQGQPYLRVIVRGNIVEHSSPLFPMSPQNVVYFVRGFMAYNTMRVVPNDIEDVVFQFGLSQEHANDVSDVCMQALKFGFYFRDAIARSYAALCRQNPEFKSSIPPLPLRFFITLGPSDLLDRVWWIPVCEFGGRSDFTDRAVFARNFICKDYGRETLCCMEVMDSRLMAGSLPRDSRFLPFQIFRLRDDHLAVPPGHFDGAIQTRRIANSAVSFARGHLSYYERQWDDSLGEQHYVAEDTDEAYWESVTAFIDICRILRAVRAGKEDHLHSMPYGSNLCCILDTDTATQYGPVCYDSGLIEWEDEQDELYAADADTCAWEWWCLVGQFDYSADALPHGKNKDDNVVYLDVDPAVLGLREFIPYQRMQQLIDRFSFLLEDEPTPDGSGDELPLESSQLDDLD